jgi:hypothetical protein
MTSRVVVVFARLGIFAAKKFANAQTHTARPDWVGFTQ